MRAITQCARIARQVRFPSQSESNNRNTRSKSLELFQSVVPHGRETEGGLPIFLARLGRTRPALFVRSIGAGRLVGVECRRVQDRTLSA